MKVSFLKSSTAAFRASAALIGLVVGVGSGMLAGSQYIQADGMFRDSRIIEMLPAQIVADLTAARPLHTKREYVAQGSEAYVVDGTMPAAVFTHVGVRCKGDLQICGSWNSDGDDSRTQSRSGGFAFEVVGGHLTSYSSGDVTEHPEAYREAVLKVAQQQIAFWRDQNRIAATKDSL